MNLLWTLVIASAVSPEFERNLLRAAIAASGFAAFMTAFWLLAGWLGG